MVVYGFLTCQDGKVWIPNKELRLQFADTVKHARKLSSVREMLRMSRELLQYTLEGNAEAVAELVGKIHATDSPRKVYASEAELSAAIKLAYLAAREDYEIVQEEQAGRGYADFIFFPRNGRDDGMILELKMDKSPEAALAQIKRNNYALRFHGKAGEPPKTTGRLILVGISSERNAIGHRCAIEILENWNKE